MFTDWLIDAAIGYDGVVLKFGVDTWLGFRSRAPTAMLPFASVRSVTPVIRRPGFVPYTSVKFDMPGRSYAAAKPPRNTLSPSSRPKMVPTSPPRAGADHAAPMLGAKLFRSVLYAY